jgi:hypothetical protein
VVERGRHALFCEQVVGITESVLGKLKKVLTNSVIPALAEFKNHNISLIKN